MGQAEIKTFNDCQEAVNNADAWYEDEDSLFFPDSLIERAIKENKTAFKKEGTKATE